MNNNFVHCNKSAQQRFTLLELVVIIAILCIVLGMAALSVKKIFSGPSAEDIAEQIRVAAITARRMAAAGGKVFEITYNRKNAMVYGIDEKIGIPEDILLIPGGVGEWNDESAVLFTFRPDGTAGGDFIILKERDANDENGIIISASPLTGAITMKMPEDEE